MVREQQTIKIAGNEIPVMALENPYVWLFIAVVVGVIIAWKKL